MKIKQLDLGAQPSFCYDRKLTSREIQNLLKSKSDYQRISTLTWILREAPMDEVWFFCSPQEVYREFKSIENQLGRRKELLHYILKEWHELGKL